MARTGLLATKLLLGFATVFAAVCAAGAQTVEQFYKGRTINFLVASAPGGINGLMARLISRHLAAIFPAAQPACRGTHSPDGAADHPASDPALRTSAASRRTVEEKCRCSRYDAG